MNSRRKAELQRRLSTGDVPRPPAGLAERIKADIPRHLEAPRHERSSIGLSLRVAASVMALITTAVITMQLMEPAPKQTASRAARPKIVPAVMPIPQRAADATSAEMQVAAQQERSASLVLAEVEERVAAPPPATLTFAAESPAEAPRDQQANAEPAAESDQDRIGLADAAYAVEAAPDVAPPPQPEPAPPVAAAPPAMEQRAERSARMRAAASAPQLVQAQTTLATAQASLPATPDRVFGISVDSNVFRNIRSKLEKGRQPDRREIDVDAVVNYFAGAPARPPRRGVRLEVEASPAPIAMAGDRAVLRFTVDTPRLLPGQPNEAVARDVRIEIDVNEQVVAGIRRIGGTQPVTTEAELRRGVSVTSLYDLELRPSLRSSQRVATVRLSYRVPGTGRDRTLEQVIHGHDLARQWSHSSRRHRLASLGAVWSQSLHGPTATADLARKAAELSSQDPKDERARELATATRSTTGTR